MWDRSAGRRWGKGRWKNKESSLKSSTMIANQKPAHSEGLMDASGINTRRFASVATQKKGWGSKASRKQELWAAGILSSNGAPMGLMCRFAEEAWWIQKCPKKKTWKPRIFFSGQAVSPSQTGRMCCWQMLLTGKLGKAPRAKVSDQVTVWIRARPLQKANQTKTKTLVR